MLRSSRQSNVSRSDMTVNMSTFSFLFSELISYYQSRINTSADLEKLLHESGVNVGQRMLDIISFRERPGKRETTMVGILQFIVGPFWQQLFGKNADSLEKSTDQAHAYMIREAEPITNLYISMPKELGRLNVAAYIAGIINGALNAANFKCEVVAHTVPSESVRDGTVFLVKFDESVALRESTQ